MFVCSRGARRDPHSSPFEGLRLPEPPPAKKRALSREPGGAGVDMYTVHAALDHSGGRMAITETYVVRDWRLIWDANRAVPDLFDWSNLQLNELW